MNLYLDVEFNGFQGELISLALVSDDKREWYEVLKIPSDPHPFVRQNVIPVLNKKPIGLEQFTASLHAFLLNLEPDVTIVADWPEDFSHLCSLLCSHNGWQLKFWPRLQLINSGKLSPEIPHNALSDAHALMHRCES